MKHDHNQILTRTGEIHVGKFYAYYEDSTRPIAMVEVLEDNSDAEMIAFKLKVSRPLHEAMKQDSEFKCSARRGHYHYPGMWLLKDPSIINMMPSMSEPSDKQVEMDMTYIKDVCKIGQGASCCRYLTMGAKGFECAKLEDKFKVSIDERVETGQMVSAGNNCEGYGK
jgi:hypothetical protein